MAALPYMQLYVAEYLADTSHLNAIQHGGYLLLLMNYWQRGKSLNNSHGRLAFVARMTPDEWEHNQPILAEFFEVNGDDWVHHRVERDLAAVSDKSDKASAAGKASAAKRLSVKSTTYDIDFNETPTDVEQEDNERSTIKIKNRTDKEQNIKNKYLSLSLPEWLKPELWDAFIEMRKKIKKPLTDYAQKIALAKLVRGYADGYDAVTVLENTVEHCWKGVYFNDKTPKRKQVWKVVGDSVEERAAYWGKDNAIGQAILAGDNT